MTRQFKVNVNGREYDVAVLEVTPGSTATAPASYTPSAEPALTAAPTARAVAAPAAATSAPASGTTADELAQMGGVIVQIDVKVGQTVVQGDRLLVLEAMKMKNHLLASRSGQVSRILVSVGDAVEGGQSLLTIT